MELDARCYIAFLDILGFKEIVKKRGNEYIKDIFGKIVASRENIKITNKGLDTSLDSVIDNTYIRILSDSIIIAIPSRFDISLVFLCECCRIIQSTLLTQNVLLRGGISCGDFYGNEEIMFGKGLVTAYELENMAEHPRIIISPEIVHEYHERVGTSTPIYITDMIALDYDNYYFINYLMYFFTIGKKDQLIQFIREKICEEKLPIKVKNKYTWLQRYFNRCITDEKCHCELNNDDEINIDITVNT